MNERIKCKYLNDLLPEVMKTPQMYRSRLTCAFCTYDPVQNPRCDGYALNYNVLEKPVNDQ